MNVIEVGDLSGRQIRPNFDRVQTSVGQRANVHRFRQDAINEIFDVIVGDVRFEQVPASRTVGDPASSSLKNALVPARRRPKDTGHVLRADQVIVQSECEELAGAARSCSIVQFGVLAISGGGAG